MRLAKLLLATTLLAIAGLSENAPLAAQSARKIVVLSEPGTPVVAAEFLLTVGPSDEDADLAGITHLAARSAVSSLRADFDSMGFHLNITSHKDVI